MEELLKIRKSMEDQAHKYNSALKKNDAKGMTAAENSLNELKKKYNHQSQLDKFSECKGCANPYRRAAEILTYPTIKPTKVKEDGIITGMEIEDGKPATIDIGGLCNYIEGDKSWKYHMEQLSWLFAVYCARGLGMTEAQIQNMSGKIMMKHVKEKLDAGIDPSSKNQLVKGLQDIIDKLLPENVDAGEERLKAIVADVRFIDAAYKKATDGSLVVSIKHAHSADRFAKIVLTVMHRLVTGGHYSMEYRERKAAAPEGPESKENQVKPDVKSNEGTPTKSDATKADAPKTDAPKKRGRKKNAEKSDATKADAPVVVERTTTTNPEA